MSSPTLFAGQKPNAAFAREQPLVDDPLRAAPTRRRGGRAPPGPTVGSSRIAGYAPAQLPRREERRPVDPLDEVLERVVVDRPDAEERRPRRSDGAGPGPVDREAGGAAPRRSGGGPRAPAARPVRWRTFAYSSRMPAANASRRVAVDERRRDADRARRVDDVDDRAVVARLDLHRGVGPRRRRAADQQRDLEALRAPSRRRRSASPRATA